MDKLAGEGNTQELAQYITALSTSLNTIGDLEKNNLKTENKTADNDGTDSGDSKKQDEKMKALRIEVRLQYLLYL